MNDKTMLEVLHLTLKKKWYDMIDSGRKPEEYREIKPYWSKRIGEGGKKYTSVQFRNGYSATAPAMRFELLEISTGLGVIAWGAPVEQEVYILHLGQRLPTLGQTLPPKTGA